MVIFHLFLFLFFLVLYSVQINLSIWTNKVFLLDFL